MARNEPVHTRITARESRAQNKDQGLNTLRDKCQVPHKGKAIRETAGLLSRGPKEGRAQADVFQVPKQNKTDCQERLLHPAMLSSKMGGQIKTFPDKHKLKQFMPTKPAVQKPLKGGGRKIRTGLAAWEAMSFTGG